jgi:hypothetical protein
MSLQLYQQRLFFDPQRGGAVKNGPVIRKFTDKPVIPNLKFEGLDVAPECDTYQIMRRFEGWTDMAPDEISAAIAYIKSVQ